VYGEDLSQRGLFRSFDDFSVPPRNVYIPLFGMVHGHGGNAFAAYGTAGDEYMEIIAFPEENTTYYTRAYPRFVYNRLYYQVYNQRGDGYYRTLEERNRFDLEIRYEFLAGSSGASDEDTGGLPADYTGIARAYRQFLTETHGLPDQKPSGEGLSTGPADIPLRIDFMMADVRDSIVGTTHEVTTTVEDVRAILDDLQGQGIEQIRSNLIGYARGGTVLSRPGTLRLLGQLGGTRGFRELFEAYEDSGVELSFFRDYMRLGEGQVLPWGNSIRSASGWYNERRTFEANAPVNLFYYARPEKSLDWLDSEWQRMSRLGASGIGIGGFGELLFSDYSGDSILPVTEAAEIYRRGLEKLSVEAEIGLQKPNRYLWPWTDRFLDMPLFSTQYLLETDTVPLLPMILNGTMELFAPYANFSAASNRDVLRLIDYNVYPSFLITRESSHLLMMTNSSEYYSTEYENYRDVILSIYNRVNAVLREVQSAEWTGRRVMRPGVIINGYSNDMEVVINYSSEPYEHRGTVIPAGEARAVAAADEGGAK
jgi:hypothetical protein